MPGLNVWLGFWMVESTIPSFSKSHAQVAGVPVDVSVNVTDSGPSPLVGANVKSATGVTGQGVPAQPWR